MCTSVVANVVMAAVVVKFCERVQDVRSSFVNRWTASVGGGHCITNYRSYAILYVVLVLTEDEPR